ncbi:MAG: ATP-binding protein, partial [Verrucomicrobiae bacterium]|nr:ATP-binding protein [Verrucomicrobiae bacterium]
MIFWATVAILVAVGVAAISLYKWGIVRRRLEWTTREIERQRTYHAEVLEVIQAESAAILNNLDEGVLLVDSSGRVRGVNRAFRMMFRVEQDAVGKSLLEVVRVHELLELFERVQREDRIDGYEFRHNGRAERTIGITAVNLGRINRKLSGVVMLFRDLSRMRQLEKAGSELVANVSHELRTPVAMIKGYIETLLGGAGEDPTTRQRFLQTIERNVNRLAALLEDLLTSAELESGRAVLNPGPVSVKHLVDEVLAEFESRAKERSVTLVNEVPEMEVVGDADRLRQVFSNLIDNAIKHGRWQGHVVVGAHLLDENRVQVHVTDDGPGIPAESLPRIFERFYRVDKSRSRELGGTGLGLSIVRDIVRAHGGGVWAESTPG